MERVASGADVDHRYLSASKPIESVQAQCVADPATSGFGVHRHHLEATGAALRDVPADVAEDLALFLGEDDEPVVLGVVKGRDLLSVVVLPVAVVVRENLGADSRAVGRHVAATEGRALSGGFVRSSCRRNARV